MFPAPTGFCYESRTNFWVDPFRHTFVSGVQKSVRSHRLRICFYFFACRRAADWRWTFDSRQKAEEELIKRFVMMILDEYVQACK
jgi:hypothetical protein